MLRLGSHHVWGLHLVGNGPVDVCPRHMQLYIYTIAYICYLKNKSIEK